MARTKASHRAAAARQRAERRPKPEPGDKRTTPRGVSYVYLPDHELAPKNGWVLAHRLDAYEARDGRCQCDAGGQLGQWSGARVWPSNLLLCHLHSRAHGFGLYLIAHELMTDERRRVLEGIMADLRCDWGPEGERSDPD